MSPRAVRNAAYFTSSALSMRAISASSSTRSTTPLRCTACSSAHRSPDSTRNEARGSCRMRATFFVRLGAEKQIARSSAANQIGRVTGEPSAFKVVRMPVWARSRTSHASSGVSRMLIAGYYVMLPGPFVADLHADGALELVYVRSPYASARLRSIVAEAARRAPGVMAVYTAGDLPIVPLWEIALIPEQYAQPALADGVVRYVGERVAAVVATTHAAARDAAEQVVVSYEPSVPVTDAAAGSTCLEWPSD